MTDQTPLECSREIANCLRWIRKLRGQVCHANLLSLEALAAAEHLGAEICLAAADHNPPLREAAEVRGVPMRLIAR